MQEEYGVNGKVIPMPVDAESFALRPFTFLKRK
jgi:hypothetical protein